MTGYEMLLHKFSHIHSLIISEDEKVVVNKSRYVEVCCEKLDIKQFNVLGVDKNQIESELCDDGAVQYIVSIEEIFILLRAD